MSRVCKGRIKIILIYSKYLACKAVRIGIIGRLGKIFGLGLNFFGIKKGSKGGKGTKAKKNIERSASNEEPLRGAVFSFLDTVSEAGMTEAERMRFFVSLRMTFSYKEIGVFCGWVIGCLPKKYKHPAASERQRVKGR